MELERDWARVLSDLAERPVDDIVFGGDIGAASAHARFFRSLEKTGRPVRFVPGNHDVAARLRSRFAGPVSDEALYALVPTLPPWSMLLLDSSTGELGVKQSRWLDGQLRSCGPVLIFVHHPVLPVDTAIDRLYPLVARDAVRERLQTHRHPVLVLCGHYHLEDEQTLGNVTQLVTPAVSFQVRKEAKEKLELDDDNYGYRLVHIEGTQVCSEVIRIARPRRRSSPGPDGLLTFRRG